MEWLLIFAGIVIAGELFFTLVVYVCAKWAKISDVTWGKASRCGGIILALSAMLFFLFPLSLRLHPLVLALVMVVHLFIWFIASKRVLDTTAGKAVAFTFYGNIVVGVPIVALASTLRLG